MGKKRSEPDYEWFTATVDCGDLTFKYKLRGATVVGGQSHDEDVSEWSEKDIKRLAHALFDVPESLVVVEYA